MLALAFLTKQSIPIVLLPFALAGILFRHGRALLAVGAAAALIALSTAVLDRLHGGWYSFYVLTLPKQHGVVTRMLADFWLWDLSPLLPAAAIGGFYLRSLRAGAQREGFLFYYPAAVGLVLCSWSGRLFWGGYTNALMPACAAIALLFGVGVHSLRGHIARAPAKSGPSRLLLLHGACLLQFALLAYNPLRCLPTRADTEAGMRLVEQIRAVDGPVFAPCHGDLVSLAGKPTFAHQVAIGDLLQYPGEPARAVAQELGRAIRERRFGAILLDTPWLGKEVEEHYEARPVAYDAEDTFREVVGERVRPALLYLPRH